MLMGNNVLALDGAEVRRPQQLKGTESHPPPPSHVTLQLHTHLYFMLVWRPMASFMWAWPCVTCRAPDPSLVLTEPCEM